MSQPVLIVINQGIGETLISVDAVYSERLCKHLDSKRVSYKRALIPVKESGCSKQNQWWGFDGIRIQIKHAEPVLALLHGWL
jgi:hypothetical protein